MATNIFNEEGKRIGYILITHNENEGYVGGYLCTDERGVPIEFLHTNDSPIKVDRFQQLLYGKSLMPELLGRHIAGALISRTDESLKAKPNILFTQEEAVLQGYEDPDVAVILIISEPSNSKVEDNNATTKKISTANGELTMSWQKDKSDKVEPIIPLLKEIDVMEPFERVSKLLQELKRQGN
ncbi:MAG: hypothetical protein ACOCZ6_06185 [Nanoarchaeota archaeon]